MRLSRERPGERLVGGRRLYVWSLALIVTINPDQPPSLRYLMSGFLSITSSFRCTFVYSLMRPNVPS